VMAGGTPSMDQLKPIIQSSLDTVSLNTTQKETTKIAVPVLFDAADVHVNKDLEQMHLAYGFPGVKYTDSNRYALTMLTTLMGGGMSSRLFQSVREREGLAYAIYCSPSNYRNTGAIVIYAGTSIENFSQAQACISSELEGLKDGISEEEFIRTARQLKGNIMINLDGSSAWANWLGCQLIYKTGIMTMPELQAQLDAIELSDLTALSKIIFSKKVQTKVSLGKDLN